ncbi:MAG: hypothetical protein OQJ78_05820 [Ignavibacteriaceae bacterium]|nr:hypothetical protein [Ignavibacteriaceae bacterium]
MSEEMVPETPEVQEKQEQVETQAPETPQEIELEIEGVKKKFKPEQILNVIKSYEGLQSKAQEYESSQTQMNNLIANLKENPNLLWDFAESLGHDPRELTRSKFKEYLEFEKMTPEQKRIYDLERKLKGVESEKEKYAKEKESQEYEAKVEQYYKQIEKEFTDFYANSDVKPSKELATELIKIQKDELDLKGQRPSVEEAYKLYKKRHDSLKTRFLESLSEDEIPESVLKAARKKLQADARKFKPPEKRGVATKGKRGGSSKTRKQLSINDFFK